MSSFSFKHDVVQTSAREKLTGLFLEIAWCTLLVKFGCKACGLSESSAGEVRDQLKLEVINGPIARSVTRIAIYSPSI